MKRKRLIDREITRLRRECDIVVSCPMAFFFAGEHAVIMGAPAMVATIPRRVIIGVRGRCLLRDAPNAMNVEELRVVQKSQKKGARIIELDPRDGLADERLARVGREIVETACRRPWLKFVPYRIRVLSDGYPGRGCNFSGAFAAALTLAIQAMNGRISSAGAISWATLPLRRQAVCPPLREAFDLSNCFETTSHVRFSGYGSACALANLKGSPAVYFPLVPPPEEFLKSTKWPIERFLLGSITNGPRALGDLVPLIVDTETNKSTARQIAQVAKRVQGQTNCWQKSLSRWFKSSSVANRPGAGSFPNLRLAPYSTIAACSQQAISLVSEGLDDRERARKFLCVVRAVDSQLRAMGLDWEGYARLREALQQSHVDQDALATKLTGGGGGGCVVVVGERAEIRKARSALRRAGFDIFFDGLAEPLDSMGPQMHATQSPNQIRLHPPEPVEVTAYEFGA